MVIQGRKNVGLQYSDGSGNDEKQKYTEVILEVE